jgi:hypothetical protein
MYAVKSGRSGLFSKRLTINSKSKYVFRSARGKGGVVEDITFSDIRMWNQSHAAIVLDTNIETWQKPTNASATPVYRNLKFNKIYSSGAKNAWKITGLPESYLYNVSFTDVEVVNAATLFQAVEYIHCMCVGVLPSCPPCSP